MQLSASAPVTWPDAAALDHWWRGNLELDTLVLRDDGTVVVEGDEQQTATVRLTGGQHLMPGATYTLEDAALGSLGSTAEVTGTAQRRTVRIALEGRRGLLGRLGLSEALVVADVAGLDGLDRVDVRSRHPYLAGEVVLVPDPAAPLTLDLRLRWLRVALTSSVVDGLLEADLAISARGVWSPAVAPVLALIGRFAREELQPSVDAWATTLNAIARGEEPSGPPAPDADLAPYLLSDEELREPRWALRQARGRWLNAQHTVEDGGWWGSRRAAWLRAYDEQPAVSWPARDPALRPWDQVAREAAEAIARAPRADRRRVIEQQVQGWGAPEIGYGLAAREPEPAMSPLTDEDVELRWLRSPLSTWRYLRRRGAVTGADPDPGAEPDDESLVQGGPDR